MGLIFERNGVFQNGLGFAIKQLKHQDNSLKQLTLIVHGLILYSGGLIIGSIFVSQIWGLIFEGAYYGNFTVLYEFTILREVLLHAPRTVSMDCNFWSGDFRSSHFHSSGLLPKLVFVGQAIPGS